MSHRERDPGMGPSAALIRAIGRALYGTHWQTDLGTRLGINRRSVQRWLAGTHEPHPAIWDELEALLTERAAEQQRLRQALAAHRRSLTQETPK